MKLLLVLLTFFLLTDTAVAQNASWFYGVWQGITYFPNGPITKRIIVKMQVTKVSGNNFTATLANLYPNDTTVRLRREVEGIITKKSLKITGDEQTYIRDPRTQNFWHDCTGCNVQSSYSISSSQVLITLTTTGCSDVCDGETTFSRDTSDFDPTQKIELAKWFGLPVNKAAATAAKKELDSTAISRTNTTDSLKKDALLAIKNSRKDTVASIGKSSKKDSVTAQVNAKKDTIAIAHKPTKKDTSGLASQLAQHKNSSPPPPALPQQDTLPDALTTRTTNLITTFKVTSPHITVQLFDNAEIDGDMVTVYHNGQLIVNHQTLTHKAITIAITASKDNPHHEFIMIADNLGLTPPNTALMRITAGTQKFELEVSSDLDNNAKITIDYTGEE